MWSEFRAFLLKTNALALAVGVIIGAAAGTLVGSLVTDVIMPPIGWLLGGVDFSDLVITLPDRGAGEVPIRIGAFINAVISFVVISLVVYWISRMFIREPAPPEVKTCPFCREANAIDASRCRACTSEI
jgi:large conductance mechanosensitive channel